MPATLASPSERVIVPGAILALDAAKSITGLGTAAFRQMRRDGLKVLYVGGRCFVQSDELIRHIQECGKSEK